MDENALRWKARIGSLKVLSVLVLLGIVVLWISAGERILQSVQGPASPAAVQIADLLGGAPTGRFVSVSGFAYYDVGYEETSDGQVVASYFVLVDEQTGAALVVRSSSTDAAAWEPAAVDLTGVTHESPTDLEDVVASDVSWFEKQGIRIDPGVFLAEGERPIAAWAALAAIAGSLGLGVLSLIPFFFPATVFTPRPIESTSSGPGRRAAEGLRATGRFQQLKRLEPALEMGKRHQQFNLSPVNLIPLPSGDLLVYIHYVLRTKLYGVVTISKQESDWGIVLKRTDPWQIEPGLLLGWKDRRALRFQRQDPGRKAEQLYLTVDDGAEQARLVQELRGTGFPVGMGMGL